MCTRESGDLGIEQQSHKLDLNLSDADKRAVQELIVKPKLTICRMMGRLTLPNISGPSTTSAIPNH
jgi:hypothetical protein